MKSPVKTLVVLTIFPLFILTANAQLATGFTSDIKKVIDDYPSQFDNILGDMIIQNPQSTDYQCKLKVNGAEECTITRYSARKKIISSWQAVMLTTENFEDARKKFRLLYTQLNNLSLRSMNLAGVYEAPAEDKKFTSVIFSFSPADESIKKLRVELVAEAIGMEWKVKVSIYDRDREDDEKGVVED